MTRSTTANVIALRPSRSHHNRSARIAFLAAMLVTAANVAGAQTPADTTPTAPEQARGDFRVSSGALAPTADAQRPAIIIESPAPDSTVRGPAIITFRTENLRMTSVFAAESPDGNLVRGGHLHVKVDSSPWHWVHATADPVVISALSPGTHTVRLELADTNHRPLDVQTVTFTIAAQPAH
jgi:hypothetical protein